MRWRSSALAVSAAVVATLIAGGSQQAAGAAPLLVGDQNVESGNDQNVAGVAEAFRTTASGTGLVGKLTVYVDASSTATTLVAGIYADNGGHPGTLLGQGSLASPVAGAWNDVALTSAASVTASTAYWIAVLGPNGAGTLHFRDAVGAGGSAETSSSKTLASLPSAWTTAKHYTDGPLSAYGSSTSTTPVLNVTPTSLTFTGTAGGASPAGRNVTISNTGGGTLVWSASADAPWLSATPASGTAATSVVNASTAGLAAGTYAGTVTFTATGATGSPAAVGVTLTVSPPDTTPPTVTLTAPTAGSTVSGVIAVQANAFDNIGVAGVQFTLDGADIGAEDTTAPYSVSWDTTGASTGTHMVSAVARDAAGNITTAQSVTVTVDNSAPTVLLGNQQVESSNDSDPAGVAEAFLTNATSTGKASQLLVYVDATSTATNLVAGLYADNGGHPGALLTQGTLAAPVPGAWNAVPVPGASITSGTNYWIAALGPVGSGILHFRDRSGSGSAETSSLTSLTSLPTTWSTGTHYNDGAISAYATGSLSSQPVLQVSPGLLGFSAHLNGPDPSPAQLTVSNGGTGSFGFTASSDSPWLTVTPTSGQSPTTLTVNTTIAGLAAGTYSGNVTVTAAGVNGSPKVVPVTLTVTDATPSGADWLQIDHDSGRSGEATGETTLSSSLAARLAPVWSSALDGKVTAQPLFVKGVQVGGQTHDVVIAATSGNSVYALDATTGGVLWRRNLGTEGGNCGIAGGFGVTGAPAVDKTVDRVYAVSDGGQLFGLNLADGTNSLAPLPLIPNPGTNKVWGGININGSTLLIATASDGCDTPPWRGEVYSVSAAGSTFQVMHAFVVVPGIAAPNGGGGIWGYGGVSLDQTTGTVFAASGDDSNEAFQPYGDRMIALDSGLGVLGSYLPSSPSQFPCAGAPCDLDFGATPVVFQPSSCPTMVAAGNKNGNVYVFTAAGLAANGSPQQVLTLNPANDWLGNGGVGGVPAWWSAGQMLFVSDVGAGVTGVSGGLVALKLQANCTFSVAWSQPLGGNSQPDSTPTVADGVVYVGEGNGGAVHAFDAATGTPLWTSAATGGAVYAAPMVADGKLFVGSWNGFTASDEGTISAFAPDTTAPTVSITSPIGGSTVSGTVTATASASDNIGVASVQFKLDGVNLGSPVTTPPYSVAWNTAAVAAGTHTLTAMAVDGAHNTTASAGVQVTVDNSGPPASVVLLGDQQIEPSDDSNPSGRAEASRTTASTSGTLTQLNVYIASTSAAATLIVGIYTDNGGHPGALLTQGSLTGPVAGAWNAVPVPPASVSSGAFYWIAVLAPAGDRTLHFRDHASTGASETSSQTTLTSLPPTWSTGVRYTDGPMSANGAGTSP